MVISKALTTYAISLRAVFCALVPKVANLSSSSPLRPIQIKQANRRKFVKFKQKDTINLHHNCSSKVKMG